MNTNALILAHTLSDQDLLSRLEALAATERETSVELVAHLAALDVRRHVIAAEGYASLFAYCRQALRLSEDAACNRIAAARACRRFPEVLDRLASGDLSLTTIRLLGRHLTQDNHRAVLARASGKSRREIEVLAAELAPRQDAPTMVRKLPAPAPVTRLPGTPAPPPEATRTPAEAAATIEVFLPPPRSTVQPTAPERHRVQLTIGPETHEKLRRLQELLRPEIPTGDPAAIFDRAITRLLDEVEKRKCGAAAIPPAVRKAVWQRDRGQCAFVARKGLRCTERHFLHYHHRIPHALGGPATKDNISLRCRLHNRYESDRVFGTRETPRRAETQRRGSGATSTDWQPSIPWTVAHTV